MKTICVFIMAALTASACAHAQLSSKVRTIADTAHGRVGVACSLPGTRLNCALNSEATLPMQSVFKLPIGMAALHAVEIGRLSWTSPVPFLQSDLFPFLTYSPLQDAHPRAGVDVSLEELLRLAVSESDNAACDILLRLLGGPAAVDTYVRSLGIENIHIVNTEKEMHLDQTAQYRNYATAEAMVVLLRRIADQSPLNAQHTALLLEWMTVSPTGPHRLKALLPPGTVIAHKTGTSGVEHGVAAATNDIGLVTLPDGRKLAVAVMVSDSTASEAVRESVIARIGRAVWQQAVDAPHTAVPDR